MSIAMMSAMSLFCLDAAAVAPAVEVNAVETSAINLQNEEDLLSPEVAEIEEIIVSPADELPEEIVSGEEEFSKPLAFEGESDDAVAQRLFDYLDSAQTLAGEFTQVAPSGAVSSGRFYLRRPGFLRFEYDPPTPLLVVANGGMVYVRDEALETTDSYPVGKTPLKFLLSKKLDLDDAKVVGVDRGVNNVAITLASDEDEAEGELTIIVKAPEMTLTRWIVRDLQNGITVVTLDNVQSGIRLANRLFRAPEAGGQFLKN